MRIKLVSVLLAIGMFGCAPISGKHATVRPLIFERPPVIQPTITGTGVRFIAPRPGMPSGGALVTLAPRVMNPNSFEVTLQTLKGTLYMDERRVGIADLQPRRVFDARADTWMKIDVIVDFSNQPTIEAIVRRVQAGQRIHFRLEGTINLDAPGVGSGMVFGPTTLFYGEMNGPLDPSDRTTAIERKGVQSHARISHEVQSRRSSACFETTMVLPSRSNSS